jgi:hypothetical protein
VNNDPEILVGLSTGDLEFAFVIFCSNPDEITRRIRTDSDRPIELALLCRAPESLRKT